MTDLATRREWDNQAYRAVSGRRPTSHRFTEFVPPGCWITSANRCTSAMFHRVDYAVAVWVEEDRPWFGARAVCGKAYGGINFHDEVPDYAESFCDPCLFGEDWRRNLVYRLFDAEGALLYVGCTSDFGNRLAHHRLASGSPWWAAVASYTITEYPTYEEAFDAETLAIRTEAPRFNIGKGGPGSWPVLRAKVAAALEELVAA